MSLLVVMETLINHENNNLITEQYRLFFNGTSILLNATFYPYKNISTKMDIEAVFTLNAISVLCS